LIAMIHYITLLRHGQTTANVESVIQGQMDFPLSATGLVQVRALAAEWRRTSVHFDLVISSHLQRARRTAELIAEALACPLEIDPAWQERHLGEAEGRDGDAAFAALERLPAPHEKAFGTGESEWDLFARALGAIQALARRPAGRYLVVSHGAFLNSVLRAVLGISPRGRVWPPRFVFDNTGYAVLEYDGDTARWSLLRLNETSHLRTVDDGGIPA
jgi:broad specificity phosphatase PhoE